MSIFSNFYSLMIHDSKSVETYNFNGDDLAFDYLIHRITGKYGMRILKQEEDRFQLLFEGSYFVPTSSLEDMVTSRCLINVERFEEGELKVTSFEKLISPFNHERKSFDRVVQCKLNTFMAYLHRENNIKTAN
ncbi:hypothetical protein [Flammeovirga aprica]|uniref:Uncharacterized protein n=1 Tax=Flammeovirga aprica JL-4 TaxID=694437 RepID=A0A7X9RT50_9BACT|nr:hypothetical protein [Flammeovirga aprica]NME67921.1 hypothetical protein [Flammeovirga aprica JL-4]